MRTKTLALASVMAVVLVSTANSVRAEETRSIGPGKVELSTTPEGRWTALYTAWTNDVSLIDGGGFIVYAVDENGDFIEIARTGEGSTEAASKVGFRKSFEGAAGGFRANAPRSDDDGDGAVDEDRLDGLDNDSDGRVDEDFAAIGDDMLVAAYRTPDLAFHQEMYAWSLPHLDGAIMISLRILNTGSRALSGVRVAAYYHRGGTVSVVREGDHVLSYASRGPRVAIVPLSGGQSWSSGAEAGNNLRVPLHDPDDVDFAEYSDGASVYAVSPAAERLEPGEEMRVDVALMAVPVSVNTSEAAERAQKTYAGDGKNLYLPPPVAMKPRMLWGYYRPLPDDEGVWLDFDVVGQAAIDARDFSYFSGIDASAIGNHELAPGRTAVTLRADVTGELTKGGDTISLKGRLDSGEFFEATLQPYRETLSPAAQAEVETFWSTPGKLARELLRVSPNPFRDATLVGYEVPSSLEREDGSLLQFSGSYETTVKIYNVAGRLINTLVERGLQPGTYSVDWPAVDDNGNRVASGVYYVRLQIERRSVTQRLIFLK